jgi:26S proteasome regulatory subunit N7
MGSDPQFAKYPDLTLAQHIFSLANSPDTAQATSLSYLQNAIKDNKMAPLYRHLAHPAEGVLNTLGESTAQSTQSQPKPSRRPSLVSSNLLPSKRSAPSGLLPWDESLYEQLKLDNEKELEQFQKEEEEAEEKAGETEIQAARSKRAEFWARVGDKVDISRS